VIKEFSETERPLVSGMKNLVFFPVFADISNEREFGPAIILVTPEA
jgi:hypothetical protein